MRVGSEFVMHVHVQLCELHEACLTGQHEHYGASATHCLHNSAQHVRGQALNILIIEMLTV